MQHLLDGLADLGALRDREALDFALVTLVRRTILGDTGTVRLVRTMGLPADQRWMVCAELSPAHPEPRRDHVWSDWSALPVLSAFPIRQQALNAGHVVTGQTTTFTTIIPMDALPPACSLLEIETAQGMDPAVIAMVKTSLRLYQNLLGLLDYGEKDALTDLLNRKSFDSAFVRAAGEPSEEESYKAPNRRQAHASSGFWLAVIDIDHFKRVNDTFGHLIGDEVLLLMARLMRATFRFHDQLYRFGGEEFVVLLRCADHGDATIVLERFRAAVLAFEFPQAGHISVSIGFTELRGDDTPDAAFDRADKAVYWAKANGRNQVCSFAELVQAGKLTQQPEHTSEASFF
jgi:diguanylate cyclase (GGDEF)-like protein